MTLTSTRTNSYKPLQTCVMPEDVTSYSGYISSGVSFEILR